MSADLEEYKVKAREYISSLGEKERLFTIGLMFDVCGAELEHYFSLCVDGANEAIEVKKQQKKGQPKSVLNKIEFEIRDLKKRRDADRVKSKLIGRSKEFFMEMFTSHPKEIAERIQFEHLYVSALNQFHIVVKSFLNLNAKNQTWIMREVPLPEPGVTIYDQGKNWKKAKTE